MRKSEIIFEIEEAEEGGFIAQALGYDIITEADTMDELRAMVRDAVQCYFDDEEKMPRVIRLHRVMDEVMAV